MKPVSRSLFLGSILCIFSAGIPWSSARAADAKPGAALKLVAQGLTAPIGVTSLADGSGRLLIVDQIGTIQVSAKDGALSETLFLDVRERLAKIKQGEFDERGLLCVALHPRFRENRKFYVVYSAPLRDG